MLETLSTGIVSIDWQKANVLLILKKDDGPNIIYCILVSVFFKVGKIL